MQRSLDVFRIAQENTVNALSKALSTKVCYLNFSKAVTIACMCDGNAINSDPFCPTPPLIANIQAVYSALLLGNVYLVLEICYM